MIGLLLLVLPLLLIIIMWFIMSGSGNNSSPTPNLDSRYQQMIKLLPKDTKIIGTGSCCICLDDVSGTIRLKMSCGCTIGLEDGCFKAYCEDIVKNGRFIFCCPKCNKDWRPATVRCVLSSAMTADEFQSFTTKVSDNLMWKSPTVQSCPNCGTYTTHDPRNATSFRNKHWVRCPVCSVENRRFEFCWVCLNPWKGGDNSCGNGACTGKDPRIQKLETCETKTIGDIKNAPKIRACVNCAFLIEHTSKCKHMTCGHCGCEFCFVCLKRRIKESGKWQCGAFNFTCEVAPRQTSLFEQF